MKRIVELVKKVKNVSISDAYPTTINTGAKRALYDNLGNNEKLALRVNENIVLFKPDGWRGNRIKAKQVKNAIRRALDEFDIRDEKTVGKVLELAKNQNEY